MLIRASGDRLWMKFFMTLDVTVDGRSMRDVIEADDEAGYVVRYVRDADGELVALKNRYQTVREEGVVVFQGQKRFSPDDAKAAAQAKRDRRQIRNIAVSRRNGGAS
ncbi:hypothetical protein ACIPUD_11100 [Bradyrhizobium sp. CAR08]